MITKINKTAIKEREELPKSIKEFLSAMFGETYASKNAYAADGTF